MQILPQRLHLLQRLLDPAHQYGVAKQEQHDFGDGDGPEREEVRESGGEVEHRCDTGGDYEGEEQAGDVSADYAAYPLGHEPA